MLVPPDELVLHTSNAGGRWLAAVAAAATAHVPRHREPPALARAGDIPRALKNVEIAYTQRVGRLPREPSATFAARPLLAASELRPSGLEYF